MIWSKRNGFSILGLLAALIACCMILNFSRFLGMYDTGVAATATFNDLSTNLAENLINHPLIRTNDVRSNLAEDFISQSLARTNDSSSNLTVHPINQALVRANDSSSNLTVHSINQPLVGTNDSSSNLAIHPINHSLTHSNDSTANLTVPPMNQPLVRTNDSSLNLAKTPINQPLVRTNDFVRDAPVAKIDVWCHGCRSQKILNRPALSCGNYLSPYVNQTQHKNDIQKVIAAYPECSFCYECSQGLYYRYDTVAPKIKQGHTFYMKTVPDNHRFPTNQIKNVTDFLPEVNKSTEFLWEYNPSIVVLPTSVRRRLGNDEFVYLASFRLSSSNYCWDHATQKSLFRIRNEFISYLGLALLRKDLSVIEEGYYSWMTGHRDFRLFVMEDNDEILLTTGNYNIPLYLLPRNESLTEPMKHLRNYSWSAGMPQVAIHARHRSCTNKAGQRVGHYQDKNFQYFIDADNNRIVELWPMGPRGVDLMGNTTSSAYYREALLNKSVTEIRGNRLEPKPTFGTIEEPFFTNLGVFDPPLGRDRGSACCIKLSGPSMEPLFVGISHVNLMKRPIKFPPSFNTSTFVRGYLVYLTRFYAFEMTSPYNVVARSGFFCMGWPSQDERGSSPFQHLGDSLKLVENFEDCPSINFVSGMTLKADDPSTAIIAYGINDCTSRMVEIDVSEIKRLLFGRIE